jgi:hypothetical protein
MLDIRLPIGLMFSILGLLLTAFGIFGSHAIYERSMGININLDWGIVLLIFGGLMLWLSCKARLAARSRQKEKTGHESH